MKHLRLVLCLSLVAFIASFSVALADFDSDHATIIKSSDTTAKVQVGDKTYMATITFADGASWDTVKDYYDVTAAMSLLESGNAAISIGSDGTASFSKGSSAAPKK